MICDSCYLALQEEGFEPEDDAEVEAVASTMGEEIADHLCEEIEEPEVWHEDGQTCACSCHPRTKARLRDDLPIPYHLVR